MSFTLPGPLRSAFGAAILLSACAAPRPLTPVSAGVLAARLANDRCQKIHGARPFAPEDFAAVLERDRWHWGSVDEADRIDGYDVDVSFNASGGGRRVEVSAPTE
jgi:hypothetical protein